MTLPRFATIEDINAIIDFLKTKIAGIEIDEAKKVINRTLLDPRKIPTYTMLGLVSKEGTKIKLTESGRDYSRKSDEGKKSIIRKAIRQIAPYNAALEWVFHNNYEEINSDDLAAYWHDNFRDEIGTTNPQTIKETVTCFFHICHAAGLGQCTIGRKGQSTRLAIDKDPLSEYINFIAPTLSEKEADKEAKIEEPVRQPDVKTAEKDALEKTVDIETGLIEVQRRVDTKKPRVFISHGRNMEIVDQITMMLDLAELEYEIAVKEETPAIPVPEKVLSSMKRCNSAIICVTADEDEKLPDGTYKINQNVLIEIGAAFVLYDKKVILLWDKRLPVPSNLQGLYRCEFSGVELSWSIGMKIMKAIRDFKG
ncbi:MAG: nucleotide-binding protein [candidate division Zixibacteria bacterium]|nr:nucleotide-binding protein [candidate division Zixibacteria bacterium]